MSQSATFSGATAKHNYTLVGYHSTEPSSPTYQTRNRETSPYQYNHVPAQTWTSRSPSPTIDASQQELKLVEVRERRSGWRGGLLLWLTLAVTVFACNAGSLIWVMSKSGIRNATPMLAESDCKKMKKTSQVVHLFINVLSTGLLHASQYVVQIATSPTRSDLDRAHSKTPRDWMNIGIPGMRNLRRKRIGRKRVVLCWILWLSSVPLHLLYNSVIFTTIASNQYTAELVSADHFASSLPQNGTSEVWEVLNPNDCIHAYAPGFVNEYHDLYVVAPSYEPSQSKIDPSLYNPISEFATSKHNNYWLWYDAEHAGFLTEKQFTAAALLAVGPWMVRGYEVSHCIAEKWTGMCSLHYHMPLMLVVLTCNVVKIGCMLWMLKKKTDEPLVTIGDAVESYLREPDQTTVPATWSTQVRHWRNAASRRTWIWYFVCVAISMLAMGIFLRMALTSMGELVNTNITYLLDLGFGAVSTSSLVSLASLPRSEAIQIIIANLPQSIFSFIYVFYTNLFIRMLLALEWSQFAHERKGLRVTNPVINSHQRSTYFLQLPYRWAIPIGAFSILMHWMVSQGLFFVKIRMLNHKTELQGSFFTLGWSAIAIIAVLIMGVVMTVVVVAFGMKKYPVGMPFAGSCSDKISSACHAVDGKTISKEKIMWGEVVDDEMGKNHCRFSAGEVRAPVSQ